MESEARSSGAGASPYRVPGEVAPAQAGGCGPRVDGTTVGVLAFVVACSLLRFGLFVFRAEHLGADPLLALATLWVSTHWLARSARARGP